MEVLIQRALPPRSQWATLIFRSSSRKWNKKDENLIPTKTESRKQVTPLTVSYHLYKKMDVLHEFSPLHTERMHSVSVAGFSAFHSSEKMGFGV